MVGTAENFPRNELETGQRVFARSIEEHDMNKNRHSHGNDGVTSLRYLLGISSRGGFFFVLTLLLSVLSGICNVLPFYALYRLIAALWSGGAEQGDLVRWGMFILISGVAQLTTFSLSMVASHVTAFRLLRDLRYSLARKLLELPLGWFTGQVSGDTRKLFTEDVEKIELFVAHHVPDFIRAAVTPVTTLIFLFVADWRLALVSLLPALLSPLFLTGAFRIFGENMDKYYVLLGRMNGTIVEYIRGMSVVRAFNRTAESFGNYRESVDEYFVFWKNWTERVMKFYGGFLTTLESGALFILGVGGPLYLSGAVTLPAFLITLILGPAYVASIKQLYFFASHMNMNFQGVSRLRAILESEPLAEPKNPEQPGNDRIEFADVTFAYDEVAALEGVRFEAKPGTVTAFVGVSGAGKTTAALLAARFYDPISGAVRIGGRDYRDVGTKELMRRVSICFQESQLFKGTIEDNIRMGNRDASMKEVVAASKAARAHEFILNLPEGYGTAVSGDRTLSGGQIQRIAIARAILKNSPVVILDEATSYADPENERLIQEALNELLAEKTVIVVAHRLKTLRHVDTILVFEKGRIVESGTWDELAAGDGPFARLWQGAEAALEWSVRTESREIDYAAR